MQLKLPQTFRISVPDSWQCRKEPVQAHVGKTCLKDCIVSRNPTYVQLNLCLSSHGRSLKLVQHLIHTDVFVPFIIYPLLHGSPDHLPLTGLQRSPLPVYSPNYLWSLISFLKASFHSNPAWWRAMLQRWRRGGAGGAWARTWCVKSNCFYISSCWLLISSTVYLHLFWGIWANSWHVSPCMFVCNNCQSTEADSLLC